jgi:hypothetical protein
VNGDSCLELKGMPGISTERQFQAQAAIFQIHSNNPPFRRD